MTDPLFVSDDDRVEAALDRLRRVRGYIYKDEIDRPMIRGFAERYPRLNLADEIDKWGAWMLDHRPRKGKKVHHRARLTTWIQRAQTYLDRGPARSGRTSTPETASAHGPTSTALERG